MPKLSTSSLTESWYALRCRPNFEFVVADQLDGKRIKNYLPALSVSPVNSRSRSVRPYFPGYLFVKGKVEELYNQRIGLMRGVMGLVSFDQIPAPIKDEILELVTKQVERENSQKPTKVRQLKSGDLVSIDDPLLEGIEARFERCVNGEERVAVLLTLLEGRTMRMELPAIKVKKREK